MRLEDVYNEIILTEKLKRINLDLEDIKQRLDQKYKEVRGKDNDVRQKPRESDVDNIIRLVGIILTLDKEITITLSNFKKNSKQSKTRLLTLENIWKSNVFKGASSPENVVAGQLFQPAKLVLLDILHEMGLEIPIYMNTQNNPVYPLHLACRFIELNVLSDLINRKKVDKKTKNEIENFIIDDEVKDAIRNRIEKYSTYTSAIGSEKVDKLVDKDKQQKYKSDVEEAQPNMEV